MAPDVPNAPRDRRWHPAPPDGTPGSRPPGPPAQAPMPAPAPATRPGSGAGVALGIAAGCLGLCGLGCLGLLAVLVALPESGAVAGGRVEASTEVHLRALGLLEEGERIVYYYDDTLLMDDTRACVVTDRRFAWTDDGTSQEARWDRVADVRSWEEMGTHVQVRTTDGTYVECEVAPLNGGEAFARAVWDTWERVQAGREGVGGVVGGVAP